MNTDLRNRVVLPVLLPLGVILGVAAAVTTMAFVLLYTNRVLALTIAVIVATGIMVAIALANSVDEEDMTVARRGVILMTGVLPLLAGIGVSLWSVNGGVPEEEWNINKEPALVAPEGAVVGAKNEQSFCAFPEGAEEFTEGNCEDTSELTLPGPPAEGDPFLFQFINLQANIQHNLQIFELAGDASAPEAGELLFGQSEGSSLINGPGEVTYNVAGGTVAPGEQYYYNCIVHPAMQGVLTVAEGGEGEAAEG